MSLESERVQNAVSDQGTDQYTGDKFLLVLIPEYGMGLAGHRQYDDCTNQGMHMEMFA